MPNFNPEKYVKQIVKWELVEGGRGELIVTIGYGVVFLLSVLAAYMAANHAAQWFLFNGDILWLEDFLRDWLFRGIDMKTWNTPGAPNFFPEMLIYALFRYGIGSVYWGLIGFGLIKTIFYMVIFYMLLSLITD